MSNSLEKKKKKYKYFNKLILITIKNELMIYSCTLIKQSIAFLYSTCFASVIIRVLITSAGLTAVHVHKPQIIEELKNKQEHKQKKSKKNIK
jgi:hypothetical protein